MNNNVGRRRSTPRCVALSMWACAAAAHAHEFIIKPTQLQVESGTKLPFNILATHVFMISEEMEPSKRSRLGSSAADDSCKKSLATEA